MTTRRTLWIAGGAIALLLLALLFGLSDLRELAARASGLRLVWVILAAAAALVSYGSIAFCQRSLLRLLGHSVAGWTIVRAVTVSTVTNRSLRSGGATGVAMLAWLLSRHGLPASAVLTSTAGFLILTNALFCVLFVGSALVAALSLGGESGLSERALFALAATAAAFAVALAVSVAVLFHDRLRGRWLARALALTGRLGRRIQRPGWAESAGRFLARFDGAARELFSRRHATGAAWGWAGLRIATSVACLHACLVASGAPVALGVLLIAYVASKTAGVVSIVPAGVGLVEGSLVAVLAGFDVPYEAALLAALLNRVVYHLLPAALALIFFGPLVRQARAAGPPGPE